VATDFVAKFAEFANHTVIRQACKSGVPKRIAGSHFRFQKIKWQWFLYIVCKFGEILSSNPGVYDVGMCTAGVDYYWS